MFSFLLAMYVPRTGIAGSYGYFRLKCLRNLTGCFLKQLHHFTFPPAECVLISPHPHQYLLLSAFLITAVLVGIKYCFTVVLISISLTTTMLSISSRAYWSFVYLWENIYSDPLPNFTVFFLLLISFLFCRKPFISVILYFFIIAWFVLL